MWRKLILLGCFVLMLGLVGAGTALGQVLVIPLAAESDDAEEALDGSIPLDSGDLEIPYDGDPAPDELQVVGLRFANVQIAKGEIVKRAYVRFDADDVDNTRHAGDVHLLIDGQLDPNPPTFEATAFNVSARPRTAAVVEWNPGRWLTAHNKDWTSDVSSVIQEIVNQEGWAAGNALVLIISDNASKPSVGMREAESFSGAGTNAGRLPTLYIELGDVAPPDEIYREAESADVLGASWRQYDSPASFGGKHIGSENGDGNSNDAAPGAEWVASYDFVATGGIYKVVVRSQKNDSDGFWIRITGATSQTHEDPDQAGTGWVDDNSFDVPGDAMGWDVAQSNNHNDDDVYWELPPGPHTLEIAKREDGLLFDSIIITSDVALDLAALPGPGASGLDMRIASASDSAEQHLDDNEMEVRSSDLEIPYETGGTPPTEEQVIGLRFPGALINRGGAIAGAYVEFEMDSVSKAGSNEPVNVIIEGELTANAAAFVEVAGDITSRLATAAKVKWSIPAGLAVNDKIRSPDISRIIREIVSLDGWGPGNALVLIIRDDKDNPSTGLRETESYEGEASAAPLLHLATLVPLAKDPNPANGATGAAFAPAVGTYFSSDVPKAVTDRNFIPPGTTVWGEGLSTLSVPDSFKIKDLNIELDMTVSGDNGDYNVYLKDPGGKQVELFTDVGWGSGFTNTILDDEASTTIGGKRDPFTGRYKPEGRLRDFDGRNAQGTWELKIIDDWYGGGATLNSWRVVIEKPLLLSWSPPGGAASQKVYFADNFEDVNGSAASAFVGNLAISVSSYDVGVLALGQTYYWRVDGIAADGAVQSTGPIWSFTTAIGNVAVSQRITNGADDVEERIANRNGDMDITSSDLELAYEDTGKGDPQIIGLRFVNVGVPAGIQIVASSIEFQVDENKGGTDPVNLLIDAQLTPDAEPFADVAYDISNRPSWTTAVVPWAVPNWPTVGVKFQTPDISSIIDEVLKQDGWASGNAIVFRIKDDPCNPSTGVRCAEAVEDNTAAPLLRIGAISEAATTPSPADGAVNVPLDKVLSWVPGLNAVWRNVYFGTSSSPKLLDATTGRNSAPKLEPSTTYYWKVDEIDGSGTVTAGTVWSFTTPPGEATAPNPADFAAGVALDATLSWTPGVTAVSHDVYFGTSSPPPFIGNQTVATFDPNTVDPNGLALGGVYYWRIDEIDAQGKKYIGDIWMFKAPREGTGTILREVWEGITGGDAVSLLTGNANYPYNPTFSDEVTLFETPTNFAENFGSRIHGYLHPDTSGEYTFWIASDDNGELWLSTDDRPANAVLISKMTASGGVRNFDDADVVPSGPIHLEGGQKYYIRVLYKEGTGGDNCAVAWQGPDSPTRAVISGYYLSPFVALWAEVPDPAVGTVLAQKFALLGWRAGVTAVSHNVYISSSLDDVTSGAAAALAGNVTTTNLSVGLPGVPVPDGLVPGSTYYWRVDEVEADPNVIHEGAVWSFSVLPEKAHNPNPADGAAGVATNKQLSWTPGLAAKLHSVYFGDNLDTVTNAVGAPPLPLTTKNPGPLLPGTTYYWRVDEFNPPALVKGDVWSFTTAP